MCLLEAQILPLLMLTMYRHNVIAVIIGSMCIVMVWTGGGLETLTSVIAAC